jgi:tRNA threonylcarbamoyladenosine biosynthesis protein TsaB
MILLAIDTSGSLCAASVNDGEAELGRAVIDLGKGHAEHLMKVIGDALAAAKRDYADLQAIAVSVGPGSFTGIRVGVATARGLALALKITANGVSTLEAVATEAAARYPGHAVLAAFTSGRGDIQAALYDNLGNLLYAPAVMDVARATELAAGHDAIVVGSAAALIGAVEPKLVRAGDAVVADIGTYALLALRNGIGAEKPKPLYLREPDAKPQAGFVLPRTGS